MPDKRLNSDEQISRALQQMTGANSLVLLTLVKLMEGRKPITTALYRDALMKVKATMETWDDPYPDLPRFDIDTVDAVIDAFNKSLPLPKPKLGVVEGGKTRDDDPDQPA